MYVAKKPCNFAGKHFAIGETIPEELIDANRAITLVKFGRIEKVEATQPETDTQPEDGDAAENAPDGANSPVNVEGGENPQSKPEGGKTDVKSPLNTKPKTTARKTAGTKPKQKGGK